MTFQLVSDLHLERRQSIPHIPQRCDTLVLAGDIGKADFSGTKTLLEHFLDDVSARFKAVVYVPGNHEYYTTKHSKQAMDRRYKLLCAGYSNVYWLNRDAVVINGIRFIGITLWSHPQSGVEHYINDFRVISSEWDTAGTVRFPLTVPIMREWHAADMAYLTRTLQQPAAAEHTIVVCHFMPRPRPSSKYPADTMLDSYFATDVGHLWPLASGWVSGHTHEAFDHIVDHRRWVCNPAGYPNETTEFDPSKVVIIA
jgi:hypothetical protein